MKLVKTNGAAFEKGEQPKLVQYIRRGRRRIGVMCADVYSEDKTKAVVGFSLCHGKLDKFDYVDGQKVTGWGIAMAWERAQKWADYQYVKTYGITNIPLDTIAGADAAGIWIPEVKIPDTVILPLQTFIGRCRMYFKDKDLPDWIHYKVPHKDQIREAMELRIKESTDRLLETLREDPLSVIGLD